MAKINNKTLNEIKRVVNNYNRKIRRLELKGTDLLLPNRTSVSEQLEIAKELNTKVEINRRIKDLQAFTKRGGEKSISVRGKTLPRYQYENIKRYKAIALRNINKKLKFYENTNIMESGQDLGYTYAQLGDREYLNLQAKKKALLNKKISDFETSRQLDNYLNTLKANTRVYDDNVFRNNYLDMIFKNATSFGLDNKKVKVIYDRLKELTPQQLATLFDKDKTIQALLYYYRDIKNIDNEEAFNSLSDDVYDVYDELYNNLDEIIEEVIPYETK